MKTSLFCFSALCLLLVTLSLPNKTTGDAPNAPYIYYYSPSKQAFIVERADGQDSRVLASYHLPESAVIEGPGWSKSGVWFAWISGAYLVGTSIDTENVVVVDKNGEKLNQIFPKEVHIQAIAWSPTDDLLMISYSISGEYALEQVIVYDPNKNSIVASINAGVVEPKPTADGAYFQRIVWSPDGRRLALQYWDKVVIFELTGQYHILDATPDNRDSCNDSDFGALPHWFKDGRIAYLLSKNSALVIDDLSHLKAFSIALTDLSGAIVSTDWSPDENYALIYVENTASRTLKHELWLLSIPDQTIERLSSDVQFVNVCNIPFDKTAWNSAEQAWFIDDSGALWLVNASPIQFSKVEQLSEGAVSFLTPIEWSDSREVRFVWSNTENYSTQIYAYDPQTDTINVLAPPENNSSTQITFFLPLTPDSLIYVDTGTAIVIEKNRAQYTNIIFQPPAGFGPVTIGKIEKDTSGKYLFLLDGTSYVSNLINVASSNGEMQRQISDCPSIDSDSCFGWLQSTDF
ncbi:MAG: hypothetical protein ABI690_23590 [Chloroflexota bacterium]